MEALSDYMHACLQVVLQFLSERLRMLPIAMLKLLCPALQLQQREQHSVVYNCGEDSTHLYLVLSGKYWSLLTCAHPIPRACMFQVKAAGLLVAMTQLP